MGRPGGVLGASWGLPEAPGGILRRKGRIVESCSRSCTINVVSSRVPHVVPSKYQLSLIVSMPPLVPVTYYFICMHTKDKKTGKSIGK